MAENREMFDRLLAELRVENTEPVEKAGGRCSGLTFVITGDVHRFTNRDAFKAYVEIEGGKVAGSVSGKTDYLINNDAASSSTNYMEYSMNIRGAKWKTKDRQDTRKM